MASFQHPPPSLFFTDFLSLYRRSLSLSLSLSLSHTHTHTHKTSVFFECALVLYKGKELANSQENLEETNNERVVLALYEALSSRDVDTVHKLLASDLEWWFHGPPSHQFMMRLLTGSAPAPTQADSNSFEFVPQSVATFGSIVLVEGSDPSRSITWVHAWTVADGIITQVREYFNTSVTVTRLGNVDQSSPSDLSITSLHCPSVWESTLSNQVGKSVPGLVLAI